MSNLRKTLAALLLVGSPGIAYLHAEKCLTVSLNTGGQAVQYKIDNLKKITFDNGIMKIDHTGGMESIPVEDVDNMRFDMELSSTGSSEIFQNKNLFIKAANGKVLINSSADTPIRVAVYDIQGHLVDKTERTGSCEVDFTSRRKGVYIIKANDKTIKYTNL